MKHLIFIIALFVSSGFALEIQNLRVVPKDINAGDMTRVMFKLSDSVMLSVVVKDLSGNSITSLVSNALYPAGQFSIPWKTSGNIGAGYYTPVITAVNQRNGETVTKRIETRTAKMISAPFNVSDLPGSGKRISYSLNESGLVSVRVGINNGPLYKIISNWELTDPGTHSVDWDGWDNDHVLQVDQLANYLIDVRYIPVEIDALHIKAKDKSKSISVPAPELLRQIHAYIPKFSVAVADKKTSSGKIDSVNLNINVDENWAIVGGVITHGTVGGVDVSGLRAITAVVDNGTSANDPADQLSFSIFPANDCNTYTIADFPLFDLAHGQVKVR